MKKYRVTAFFRGHRTENRYFTRLSKAFKYAKCCKGLKASVDIYESINDYQKLILLASL